VPGIIAVFGNRQAQHLCGIADSIAEQMYESLHLARCRVIESNGLALMILHTGNDFFGTFAAGDWTIAWYGRAAYNGRPIGPEIIPDLDRLWPAGLHAELAYHFQGNFQAAIYSKSRHELLVLSDRISTHALYTTETEEWTAIVPETLTLRALTAYGWRPSIREGAVFEFMASGYLWGDGTYWNEVRFLGPGRYLLCRPEGAVSGSYWEMSYTPSTESPGTLGSRLYAAIGQDFDTLPTGRPILTLSGGSDSRSLLGFLHARGIPCTAVSYNFGDAYTASDAGVGKYYAEKLGQPHFFFDADLSSPSRLIEDIRSVIAATGGESDGPASQDAFLGREFYKNLAAEYDYLLRGDELWGRALHAASLNAAFLAPHLYTMTEFRQPEAIMRPEQYSNAVSYLENLRRIYTDEFKPSPDGMNEFRDYLFWRHRQARFLQNMAYFRRTYIPQITPFLLDATVAITMIIPGDLRTGKKLFQRMNEDCFPDLFLDGNAPSPYMTEGTRFDRIYQMPEFREFVLDHLIRDPPAALAAVLDPERLEHWMQPILAGTSGIQANNRSYNVMRFFKGMVNRNKKIAGYLESLLIRSGRVRYPYLDSKYLFRLLVLSLALREYETACTAIAPQEVSVRAAVTGYRSAAATTLPPEAEVQSG